jgi:hypothetical protein
MQLEGDGVRKPGRRRYSRGALAVALALDGMILTVLLEPVFSPDSAAWPVLVLRWLALALAIFGMGLGVRAVTARGEKLSSRLYAVFAICFGIVSICSWVVPR